MEAVQFSTVASSRQFSAASHSHSFSSLTCGQNQARKPPSSKLWTGSTTNSTTSLSSRNLFSVSQKQTKHNSILIMSVSGTCFPWLHLSLVFFFFFFGQREVWGWVNSKSVTSGRRGDRRGLVVRAEMFGQLTSGLEAAWNKLKGEGSLPFTVLFFIHILIKEITKTTNIFTSKSLESLFCFLGLFA